MLKVEQIYWCSQWGHGEGGCNRRGRTSWGGVRWSIVGTLKGAVKMSFVALNSPHSVNISTQRWTLGAPQNISTAWNSFSQQHAFSISFLKVPHFGRFPHRLQLVQAFSFSPPQVNKRSGKLHEQSEGSRTRRGGAEELTHSSVGAFVAQRGTESSGALLNISSIWCHYRPSDHRRHHQRCPRDSSRLTRSWWRWINQSRTTGLLKETTKRAVFVL